MKEIGCVSFFSKVQAKACGARIKNWFWLLDCAGTAGVGWESGNDFAAQQFILPPLWQQARFCLTQGGAACAKRNGAPASRELQTMANAVFMLQLWHDQLLASFLSASRIIFMYLAGSLSKALLQPPQQSLTSCP